MNRYEIKEKSPSNKFWNLSIWNKLYQTMVREINATWNPIYTSILLMYKKLANMPDFIEHVGGKVQ